MTLRCDIRRCDIRGLAFTTAMTITLVLPAAAPAAAGAGTPSGGAGLGGLAPTNPARRSVPPPPSKRDHGTWLRRVTVTEYWPAPEKWFTGALVSTPGLSGEHRVDWLYSATGVSMQGEGIGLDGRLYHIDSIGNSGWVTSAGVPTAPADGWSAGPPYWRAGAYWKNNAGGVTFPLRLGGWSAGRGRSYVSLRGVMFSPGPSRPLRYYRSIAVDPRVIALGSRVYLPAYRHDRNGGWFLAQDTGGAIGGRHLDVYRSPPASSSDTGRYLIGQRAYVIEPRR